jgi:hypothetical protein
MVTVRADDAYVQATDRFIRLFIYFFKEEKEGKVKLSLGQGKRRKGKVDSPGVITI